MRYHYESAYITCRLSVRSGSKVSKIVWGPHVESTIHTGPENRRNFFEICRIHGNQKKLDPYWIVRAETRIDVACSHPHIMNSMNHPSIYSIFKTPARVHENFTFNIASDLVKEWPRTSAGVYRSQQDLLASCDTAVADRQQWGISARMSCRDSQLPTCHILRVVRILMILPFAVYKCSACICCSPACHYI